MFCSCLLFSDASQLHGKGPSVPRVVIFRAKAGSCTEGGLRSWMITMLCHWFSSGEGVSAKWRRLLADVMCLPFKGAAPCFSGGLASLVAPRGSAADNPLEGSR